MTNTTRRSFIKKSVVAVVAATNLIVLSGLVDATEQHPSPGDNEAKKCKWVAKANQFGNYVCYYENADGSCTEKAWCGVDVLDDSISVNVDCAVNQDLASGVVCDLVV